MRLATKVAYIRITFFFSMLAVGFFSYHYGREAGISYAYNRGFCSGYACCRGTDEFMNRTPTGDIFIPHKQIVVQQHYLDANDDLFGLKALNDKYLDYTVVWSDKALAIHDK
jgi:hypothetical protein